MKYNYSKLAFVCSSIIVGLLCLIILFFYGLLIGAEKEKYYKVFFICSTFFAFCVLGYSGEYLNRFIILNDNYIRFNSFRFKRIKKVISFSVSYNDIISIKAKTFPIIGLWGISIVAKNFPRDITLSLGFKSHKNMFKEVCVTALQHNPNVYIDPRLQDYIERN